MTVSSIVPVNNYKGNSSTKIFDFDFLIEDEKELVVHHYNSNGVEKKLLYGIDYSITGIGDKNGGSTTFPIYGSSYNKLGPDESISLSLSLQIKQESEFHNSSFLNLDVLEWTFDYLVRILQILNRKIDRCVKVEESESLTPDNIMNQLNEKCGNVDSTYNEILELIDIIEEKVDISTEKADIASENAEIATEKAKKAGKIIGEHIAVYCSKDYVPECCLPCDGTMYTSSMFSELWNNFLTSETSQVELDSSVVISSGIGLLATKNNCGVLNDFKHSVEVTIPVNSSSQFYGDFGISFRTSSDIQSYQYLAPASLSYEDDTLFSKNIFISDGYIVVQEMNSQIFNRNQIYPNTTYFLKYTRGSEAGLYDIFLVKSDGSSIQLTEDRVFSENTLKFMLNGSYFFGQMDLINSYYTDAQSRRVYLATTERNTLLSTCSIFDYEKEILESGQCAKFAVDFFNEKFKTPFIKEGTVIQQAFSDGKIAEPSCNYISSTSGTGSVNLETVALRNFVVVSDDYERQSLINWNDWISSLDSKVDVDLSNVSHTSGLMRLVDVYSNGTNYYKIFEEVNPETGEKKKWCKQGGYSPVAGTAIEVEVTLFVPYLTTDYQIYTGYASVQGSGATIRSCSSSNPGKTVDSFIMYTSINYNKYWTAEGYIS